MKSNIITIHSKEVIQKSEEGYDSAKENNENAEEKTSKNDRKKNKKSKKGEKGATDSPAND